MLTQAEYAYRRHPHAGKLRTHIFWKRQKVFFSWPGPTTLVAVFYQRGYDGFPILATGAYFYKMGRCWWASQYLFLLLCFKAPLAIVYSIHAILLINQLYFVFLLLISSWKYIFFYSIPRLQLRYNNMRLASKSFEIADFSVVERRSWLSPTQNEFPRTANCKIPSASIATILARKPWAIQV